MDTLSTMLISLASLLLLLFSQLTGISPLACLVAYLLTSAFQCRTRNFNSLNLVLSLLLIRAGYHTSIVPVILFMRHWDRSTLPTTLISPLFPYKEYISDIDLAFPTTFPTFGANSYVEYFRSINDMLTDVIGATTEASNTNLYYLRAPGVNDTLLPSGSYSGMAPSSLAGDWVKYTNVLVNSVYLVATLIAFAFVGVISTLGVLFTYYLVIVLQRAELRSTVHRVGAFRDGVYRVEVCFFGIPWTKGIAVSHNGVLHSPFHVNYASNIRWGGAHYLPYYQSPSEDLVTYGGPPQFTAPVPGDTVIVNCETDNTRVSYLVEYEQDVSHIAWRGVTQPGESGSPVYISRPDGTLSLAGLAGRYVDDGNFRAEFLELRSDNVNDDYIKIVSYPGSGKTRNHVARLLNSFYPKLKNKRVLITGPTVLVCQELYKALSQRFVIGLNVRGSYCRNSRAQIQIAAHATAMSLLTSKDTCISNLGMIIIDEAHVEDPTTIMLRRYSSWLNAQGVIVVELSATLDGEHDSRSNHYIFDLPLEDPTTKATELLQAGMRTLWFVTGKNQYLDIAKKFHDYKPVYLCRDNICQALRALQDPSRLLILSTDIAECGINIPNLDAVIDPGKKFKYVVEGNSIMPKVVNINEASRIQRRGRVGRTKPGYYYHNLAPPSTTISSASLDAEILMTGRYWAPEATNSWNIKLSDAQFLAYLKQEKDSLPPLGVYLAYDAIGFKRPPSLTHAILKDLTITETWKCPKSPCRCPTNLRINDARLHDFFNPTT